MAKNSIEKVIRLSESLEALSEPIDLYILFIDLCKSTKIKQFCLDNEMPDSIWIMRQKVFLSRTADIIQQYGGTIIKTIGDEVMATFTINVNPQNIIKCVVEVFQTFQNLKSYNKGIFQIKSKASIDFGQCYDGQVLDYGIFDPIGNSVDRCARLSKNVGENEIVFSEDFKNILYENKIDIEKYNCSNHSDSFDGLGELYFYKITF